MAASAKTLLLEKPDPTDDWTIVLPRRGKQRRKFPIIVTSEQQEQSWAPLDIETNPERESNLMQKMQIYIRKLESSLFWHTFQDQIQTPDILDHFLKVLGSEPKMQMVIYGIGSIESFEPPRLQLSLAILMKRRFNWIGNVEVFDPIISLTESKVLEALGCSVLSVNEQGRQPALKPTLFFMPHCEIELYDNLLQTNWRVDLLNQMVLFGNSFESYNQQFSLFKKSRPAGMGKYISAVRKFTKEFGINTVSDDYSREFYGSCWHFFDLHPEAEFQLI